MGCCRSDRNQIHQKMLPTVSITKISKGCHPLSVRRLKGTQAVPAVPQGNEQQCEAEMQKSACSRRKAHFPLKRGDVRNKQSVDLQPKSLFSELATKCSNSATHTKLESTKMAAGSQNLKYLVWTDHILFSELEGTSRTSFCSEVKLSGGYAGQNKFSVVRNSDCRFIFITRKEKQTVRCPVGGSRLL